jgi:hypothetical protein
MLRDPNIGGHSLRQKRKTPPSGAFCVSSGDDGDENSPVIRRVLRLTLRAVGFADVRSGILPPQSTNSSGTNLDSRRLAP